MYNILALTRELPVSNCFSSKKPLTMLKELAEKQFTKMVGK